MDLTPRLLQSGSYRIIDQNPEWVGPWMTQQGAGTWRSGSTCIGLVREGELVAGAMYDYFNGASIFASIAIKGPITRTWLWYIFYYPFVELKSNVILGLVSQDNILSQRLVEHFGFSANSLIPEGDPSGFLVLYTMPREHCRFIRSPYGQVR